MTMTRAVLFDMDGVLVFSEEAWFLVYNDTLESFGHAPVSRADFDAIYGNGTEADRDTYMPERTLEEVDQAYARFFDEHLDAIRPNPEAAPILRVLREAGVLTAVATNTQHRLARRILNLVELSDCLNVIACADEAGAAKPDPAVVNLAAKRLSVAPADCLFVGDSVYDEEAAQRAGVSFLRYRAPSPVRIDSLFDLLPRIGLPGRA